MLAVVNGKELDWGDEPIIRKGDTLTYHVLVTRGQAAASFTAEADLTDVLDDTTPLELETIRPLFGEVQSASITGGKLRVAGDSDFTTEYSAEVFGFAYDLTHTGTGNKVLAGPTCAWVSDAPGGQDSASCSEVSYAEHVPLYAISKTVSTKELPAVGEQVTYRIEGELLEIPDWERTACLVNQGCSDECA